MRSTCVVLTTNLCCGARSCQKRPFSLSLSLFHFLSPVRSIGVGLLQLYAHPTPFLSPLSLYLPHSLTPSLSLSISLAPPPPVRPFHLFIPSDIAVFSLRFPFLSSFPSLSFFFFLFGLCSLLSKAERSRWPKKGKRERRGEGRREEEPRCADDGTVPLLLIVTVTAVVHAFSLSLCSFLLFSRL